MFHFQYCSDRLLRRWTTRALISAEPGERVLDLGAGRSPYRQFRSDLRWTTADVDSSCNPDFLLEEGEPLPFPDDSFDVVLCTQVLEHAAEPASLALELKRVVRPSGLLLINVPFLYPRHGSPVDYRRYTPEGLADLLGVKPTAVACLGGIGSTVALNLNTFPMSMAWSRKTWAVLVGLGLPIQLVFSVTLNSLGLLADALDRTQTFPLHTAAAIRV